MKLPIKMLLYRLTNHMNFQNYMQTNDDYEIEISKSKVSL